MYETVLQKRSPEMFYKVFLEILQNSQEKTSSQMYETVLQKRPPEMFYKVFLEILQNSQEITCGRDSFFLWILRNF